MRPRIGVKFCVALLTAITFQVEATATSFTVDFSVGTEVERYFAIVPSNQPWRQPALEELISEGEHLSGNFQVPTGRYFYFCSADGYAHRTGVLSPVEDDQEPQRLDCSLEPLVRIRGRVLDRDGVGVPGATVGYVSRFDRQHPAHLSPLGESHLAKNYMTQTDERGEFALAGPKNHTSQIWVEAKGRAPVLRDVKLGDGSNVLTDIKLVTGGSLTLRVAVPEAFPREQFKFSLRPPRGTLWESTPAGLWQRPLRPETSVHWPALPPGHYELWLKGSYGGAHQITPHLLREFDVEPGQELVLHTELPQGLGHPAVPDASPIQLYSSDPLLGAQPAKILLLTSEVTASLAQNGEVVTGGRTWQILQACDDRAPPLLRVVVGERISQPLHLSSEMCEQGLVELVFEPLAWVRGTFVPPLQAELPEVAFARVSSCGSRKGPPEEVPLVLSEDKLPHGHFLLPIPAGCRQLSFWPGTYAPVELPAESYVPGSVADVGSFNLVHGSAILVQVLDARDSRPLEDVEVQALLPTQLVEASASALEGDPARAFLKGVRTGARGWARIFGLPSGPVYLYLRKAGYYPRITQALDLESGREHRVPALELGEPGQLEVEVRAGSVPPSDLPLRVGASFASSCAVVPPAGLSKEVPATGGTVTFRDLSPGLWEVSVEAGGGSTGTYRLLGRTEAEVGSGRTFHQLFELSEGGRHGLLLYRDRPVPGRLTFFPEDPEGGDRPQESFSDESGEFPVPEGLEGICRVRVELSEPPLSTWVPNVDVDVSDEGILQIVVPSQAIEGVVVDSDEGSPVAGAWVTAVGFFTSEEAVGGEIAVAESARTDEAGQFSLSGLPSGKWQVRAQLEDLASSGEVLDIAEDETITGVELELKPARHLDGRLVNSLGSPVSGAIGQIEATFSQRGEFPFVVGFRTDSEGRFSLALPPDLGEDVHISVLAPGHAVWARRMPLIFPLEITLPIVGGKLEIEADSSELLLRYLPFFYLVNQEDGVVPLTFVFNVLRESTPLRDGHLTVNNLAPGAWRLVYLPPGEAPIARRIANRRSASEALGSFTSAPGSAARIRLGEPR